MSTINKRCQQHVFCGCKHKYLTVPSVLCMIINILKCNRWALSLFLVRVSEVTHLCPSLCDPMDCNLPGSSVHGIFQARVLEWVAISYTVYKCVLLPTNFILETEKL